MVKKKLKVKYKTSKIVSIAVIILIILLLLILLLNFKNVNLSPRDDEEIEKYFIVKSSASYFSRPIVFMGNNLDSDLFSRIMEEERHSCMSYSEASQYFGYLTGPGFTRNFEPQITTFVNWRGDIFDIKIERSLTLILNKGDCMNNIPSNGYEDITQCNLNIKRCIEEEAVQYRQKWGFCKGYDNNIQDSSASHLGCILIPTESTEASSERGNVLCKPGEFGSPGKSQEFATIKTYIEEASASRMAYISYTLAEYNCNGKIYSIEERTTDKVDSNGNFILSEE